MYFAGLRIPDPKLDRLGRDILESESLSIRAPYRDVRASARRQRDVHSGAIGDLYEFEVPHARCDSVTAWGIVLTVIL